MMFQIENLPEGYVVSCYHDWQWHSLRNFGDRQGDAICFRDYDCPKMDDTHIRMLEKAYTKEKRYIRVSNGITTKYIIKR